MARMSSHSHGHLSSVKHVFDLYKLRQVCCNNLVALCHLWSILILPWHTQLLMFVLAQVKLKALLLDIELRRRDTTHCYPCRVVLSGYNVLIALCQPSPILLLPRSTQLLWLFWIKPNQRPTLRTLNGGLLRFRLEHGHSLLLQPSETLLAIVLLQIG